MYALYIAEIWKCDKFMFDGVYVTAADGRAPVFIPPWPLSDEDVQEIIETAAKRIVRLLQRR